MIYNLSLYLPQKNLSAIFGRDINHRKFTEGINYFEDRDL